GDAKRNDIGYSATGYARSLFEQWGFDSITVNPYLGMETLEPFAGYSDRGVFVLCRTSNPGSGDFQSLRVESGELLYEVVARRTVESNRMGGFGLVVGATYPAELVRVRAIAPELPILIPGVGAQAGDLEAAVRGGCDASGAGAIVNVGRQIVLASSGADFAAAARRVATQIRAEINRYRPPAPTS
ncbi:MAG: orotidine-5'-phosphate decarboxylase, partial [Chloroflexi bacterium]|nr:orotidine-5'-phosphate decarboxylase [Chloroflexota bacterium]